MDLKPFYQREINLIYLKIFIKMIRFGENVGKPA